MWDSHWTSCSLKPLNGSGIRPALRSSTWISEGKVAAFVHGELTSSSTEMIERSRSFQLHPCLIAVTRAAILNRVAMEDGFAKVAVCT